MLKKMKAVSPQNDRIIEAMLLKHKLKRGSGGLVLDIGLSKLQPNSI